MSGMMPPEDDLPRGYDVRRQLKDIIYQLDPDEAPLAEAAMRLRAKQILDELVRADPRWAAERRKRRRELKAWKREQDRLAREVGQLQIPFIVAAVNAPDAVRDVANIVLNVSKYLFESQAPADLIRDLLTTTQQWLPR
jgi:hypothetical protein